VTFSEFVGVVFAAMDDNPEWRQGQALFNTYAAAFPEKAERLRLSAYNPFYDDGNVAEAWDFIGRNWDNSVDV